MSPPIPSTEPSLGAAARPDLATVRPVPIRCVLIVLDAPPEGAARSTADRASGLTALAALTTESVAGGLRIGVLLGAGSGRLALDSLATTTGRAGGREEPAANPADPAGLAPTWTDEVDAVVGAGGFAFPASLPGLATGDLDLLLAAAAAGGAHARDVLVVAPPHSTWLEAAAQVGARAIEVGPGRWPQLHEAIGEAVAEEAGREDRAGVGPHPGPLPDDPRLDPKLLAAGDRRNVVDRYRYWRESAIVADLDARRRPFHVAIENWQHDLNIGTVVRNANAFNAAGVHIVGRRRWNRRGAMATDRYLTVSHHRDVASFGAWATEAGLAIVGIDNVDGAVPIDDGPLPARCVLVFGQEGPGLSAEMVACCTQVRAIAQEGSTRSLNAGVASGIAMYAWVTGQAQGERA